MSWINKLEPRLGRYAVPGLVRIIAVFHALTFVLLRWVNTDFIEALVLDPNLILAGEVWRLVSWVFVPRSLQILWVIFAVMFLMFVGEGLEEAWGAFRVNVYVFATVVLVDAAAFLLPPGMAHASIMLGEILFASLTMAFAINYPEVEIRLFAIIPVKMKWIGLLTAAFLVMAFIPASLVLKLSILVALIPFFVYALPLGLRHLVTRQKVAVRRARFQQNQRDESDAFHTCHRCGQTDADDPSLDFRVAHDGEEYCTRCLEAEPAAAHASSPDAKPD